MLNMLKQKRSPWRIVIRGHADPRPCHSVFVENPAFGVKRQGRLVIATFLIPPVGDSEPVFFALGPSGPVGFLGLELGLVGFLTGLLDVMQVITFEQVVSSQDIGTMFHRTDRPTRDARGNREEQHRTQAPSNAATEVVGNWILVHRHQLNCETLVTLGN